MVSETDSFEISRVSEDFDRSEYSGNTNMKIRKDSRRGTIKDKHQFPFRECLVNATHRQFACIHGECLGHSDCIKNELSELEPDFHCLHFHPVDKILLCEEIFPDILRFMKTVPEDKLPDYRFSFNHRYIRKDGSITQFLQEGILSFSESDRCPVLNLLVFTETGDMKTDDSMVLTIFRYDADQGYQKVYAKSYIKRSTVMLSQRELEIIKLCLEGMSSKMIADKLNISIHTVKNHKRNCMEKTCTRNITELIHVCIRSNWLQ
jgi:DNA-binding CsgD family transcriptional regulator